jgi:hypothetical protein
MPAAPQFCPGCFAVDLVRLRVELEQDSGELSR